MASVNPQNRLRHGAHAAGTRSSQSKRPRREADRRWADAEVDGPADRGRTGVFYVSHEQRRERQAGDGRRGAAQPCDLEDRDARDDRFLHDDGRRIGNGGDETEHDAENGAGSGLRGRNTDDGGAEEGDGAAGEQPPRKPFAEEGAGKDGDQQRAATNQHRRRTGIDASFGRVQGDAVDA